MGPKDPALQGEEGNTSVRGDIPSFEAEFSTSGRISLLSESSLESAFYRSLFDLFAFSSFSSNSPHTPHHPTPPPTPPRPVS